jgi:spermidine synthase
VIDLEEPADVGPVELPSPFSLKPGTLRVLEPPEGFSNGEYLVRWPAGALHGPFIVDGAGARHLLFSAASVQSSMQLDDPYALVTAYTRKMMAFLLFLPEPRHVLMIGLGGGSLAKFCYRHLPQTRISVVESNADVISLREHFSIPPDDERFEIVHADGAAYLARVPPKVDVILIDAFDELGVAPSLASPDFHHRASESLTPDGVLVMNLCGQKTRYPIHVQSLCEAFDGAVVLVPVQADDNVLLFAFKRPSLAEVLETLHDRATKLEQALGLEFRRFLECLRSGPTLGTHTGCS